MIPGIDDELVPLGSKYWLHRRIGRGWSGEVWQGSLRDDSTEVAVKLLAPELSSDPQVVARFLQERMLLVSLSHPNVVRVRDLVIEGDTLGLVMDLMEGGSLRARLTTETNLPPPTAVRIVKEVLLGLEAIHRAGLVHGDVKPENVLFVSDAENARAVVVDAGIASIAHGSTETNAENIIGTPEYLAPEVIAGEKPTGAADLYACGIMLYELLCGQTPFAGGYPLAVMERHVSVAPRCPAGAPDGLWAVIADLLAKSPAARPKSAAEAIQRLESYEPQAVGGRATSASAALPVVNELTLANDEAPTMFRGGRQPVPAARGGEEERASDKGRTRLVWGLGSLIAALFLSGLVAAFWPRDTKAASPLYFSSTPRRQVDGLVVTRVLELSGKKGSHVKVNLKVTNEGTAPFTGAYEEVIPKSLAKSVDVIRSRPSFDRVIERDPIVQYRLTAIPPGQAFGVTYEAELPAAGLNAQRLKSLAEDQEEALENRMLARGGPPAAGVSALDVEPKLVTLREGEALDLQISGVMSDNSPASRALIEGVTVTTSDPRVAGVQGLAVIGGRGGEARVSVQAGPLNQVVQVKVLRRDDAERPARTKPGFSPGGVRGPGDCMASSGRLGWALAAAVDAFTDSTKTKEVNLGALAPGQRPWIVLYVRNTGNVGWCREGRNPVLLRTEAPPDRPSALATPEWSAPTRPARLTEAQVASGEVGTFEFPIGAPAAPGPFQERLNLVVEGLTAFDDIGFSLSGAVKG